MIPLTQTRFPSDGAREKHYGPRSYPGGAFFEFRPPDGLTPLQLRSLICLS